MNCPGRGEILPGVWLLREKEHQDQDDKRDHEAPVNSDCDCNPHPRWSFGHSSSPPLRWHGPQVVLSGLRIDGPIFRTDLATASHAHKEGAISLWVWICCGMCEPSHAAKAGECVRLTRFDFALRHRRGAPHSFA